MNNTKNKITREQLLKKGYFDKCCPKCNTSMEGTETIDYNPDDIDMTEEERWECPKCHTIMHIKYDKIFKEATYYEQN